MTNTERAEELLKMKDVSGNILVNPKYSIEDAERQVELFLKLKPYNKNYVINLTDECFEQIGKVDIEEYFYKRVKEIFNYDKGLDLDFWYIFGRVSIVNINEILPNFDKCYTLVYAIDNKFNEVLQSVEVHLQRVNDEGGSSPYNSYDELVNSVVYAKIEEEAKNFYTDKSKDWGERLRVFNKFGYEEGYIFEPNHPKLKTIFDMYNDLDWTERHQRVECSDVIHWWMSKMVDNRIMVDYSKNEYHPSLKEDSRGYTPSKGSVDKLTRKYMELVMMERVNAYIFDW